MTNQVIAYDVKNEEVRIKLSEFISDRGVKQSWICSKVGLSGCSISLFLSSKRMLTDEYLDRILDVIS